MTRHVASTRDFPMTYSQSHPYVEVSPAFRGRPCEARMPVMAPLPVAGAGGQPYMGMDPSAPVTWVRPWNPQPGMVARLMSGQSIKQSVAWAKDELEGFVR